MPKITYVQPDGLETVLDSPAGISIMRTAVANGVPGIVAECGGSAMCATCHVYVPAGQDTGLPPVSEVEDELLECTASERTEESRLSCQLPATGDLRVFVPREQI